MPINLWAFSFCDSVAKSNFKNTSSLSSILHYTGHFRLVYTVSRQMIFDQIYIVNSKNYLPLTDKVTVDMLTTPTTPGTWPVFLF